MPLKTPELTKFTTSSPFITSFNFIDIANGTGVQTFYGIFERPSSGLNFFLSSTSNYPSAPEILDSSDMDLDLTPFTTSRTVTGTAIFKATTQLAASRFTIQLRKWDGTSETNITSAIQTLNLSAGTEAIIRLPITETRFAAGDVLRLNINGRLEVAGDKVIELQVPFKLDL